MKLTEKFFLVALIASGISGMISHSSMWLYSWLDLYRLMGTDSYVLVSLAIGYAQTACVLLLMFVPINHLSDQMALQPSAFQSAFEKAILLIFLGCWIGNGAAESASILMAIGNGAQFRFSLYTVSSYLWIATYSAFYETLFVGMSAMLLAYYRRTTSLYESQRTLEMQPL